MTLGFSTKWPEQMKDLAGQPTNNPNFQMMIG